MFSEFNNNSFILPTGNIKPEVYILGDYPTKKDILIGKAFSSNSGEILKYILEHLKINPEKVRYNYAFNSEVKESDSIFCKGPSDLQINECRQKVFEDIKATKPKVIIAMGDSALKCLFNRSEPGIFGWRGHLVPSHELNCWVVPTFSPRKILQDGIIWNL